MKLNLGAIPLSADILDKANIGLWAFELDEQKEPRMYVDDTMLGLIGLSEQTTPEKTYHAWYDHVDPEHYDAVNASVEKMIAGIHAEVQYPWHHPDGHIMLVRCGGVRNFAYTAGIRIEGIHMDVTEVMHFNKENERQRDIQQTLLKQNYEHTKFRADALQFIAENDCTASGFLEHFESHLLELTGCDQIKYWDVDGNRFLANSKHIGNDYKIPEDYCSHCEFSNPFSSVFKDGAVVLNDCSEGLDGVQVYEKCPVKSEMTRKVYLDGKTHGYLSVHYLNNCHTFTEAGKETLQELTSILSLVLSRLKAKNENAELEMESRKTLQETLKSMRDIVHAGIWSFDISNETLNSIYWSDEFRYLLGYTNEDDFPNTLEAWSDKLLPDDREATLKHLWNCITDNTGLNRYDLEYRMIHKSGEVRWFHAVGRILTSAENSTQKSMFGTFIDITAEHENVEQNLKTIEGLASEYTSVYYINLDDNSFVPYSMNEATKNEFGEAFSSGISYSDAFKLYTEKTAYAPDVMGMLEAGSVENIKRQLEGRKYFRHTYRSSYSGSPEYREMTFVKPGNESEEPKFAVLGFSDKNEEILSHMIGNLFFEDYAVIYLADLDNDSIKAIKSSKIYDESNPGSDRYCFSSQYRRFADIVDDEDAREFFIKFSNPEYLKEYLSGSGRKEFVYHVSSLGHWYRIDCRVLDRNERNEVSRIIITHHIIDNERADQIELTKQLEQALAVSDYFTSTFVSAYYVNLNDYSVYVYGRSSYLQDEYPDVDNFLSSINDYISRDVHPADREMMYREVQPDNIRKRLAEEGTFSVTLRDISKGITKDYRFLVIPGADEDHAAFGFMDITEEVRKEKETNELLEKALQAAQTASKAKTDFLFNMSHDIRTPMNAITGYTALAKSHIEETDKVKGFIDKIDISGRQLLSLINQVLEMSRIESGKVVLTEEPTDVVERAREMETVAAADIGVKDIHYTLHIGNIEHRNVITDVSRVNQIVTNIIGNAVKYTPDGGCIDYYLEEKTCDKEGCGLYVISISDTGIGMSEEYLERIFEEFSRENTSTVSHIQGTGLGMSIVKKVVDLMGGTIDIKSKTGKGTTVTVAIPMKWDENAGEIEDKENEHKAVSLKGKRILLVEDNEMNREIATDILETADVIVETAENGQIAVDKLASSKSGYYDCILMDVQMPVMNGYEATKAIRSLEDKNLSSIPVIAMTANAFEEDRIAAIEAGMDDHMAKPINIHKLFEKMSKYI